MTTRDR
jgi:hypothetical protein